MRITALIPAPWGHFCRVERGPVVDMLSETPLRIHQLVYCLGSPENRQVVALNALLAHITEHTVLWGTAFSGEDLSIFHWLQCAIHNHIQRGLSLATAEERAICDYMGHGQ